MQKDINIRIDRETHKRLKVGASKRSKKMKNHIEDLSKLSLTVLKETK